MRRMMQRAFEQIGQTIRRGAKTPVEIIIGIATAMVMSAAVTEPSPATEDFALTFGMIALPCLLAVFATSTLHAFGVIDAVRRWGLTAAYIAGAVGYGVFVLDTSLQSEVWRWTFLTAALGLGAMLTPLAARHATLDREALTWRFNLRLLVRSVLSGAYACLLMFGLSLGLIAINNLFETRLGEEVPLLMAIWIFVCGGTWMIASGLPDYTDTESPISKSLLKLVGRIGTWLVMPVLGLYMLILYAYGFRVIITGEVPSNVLSPLALGAAALGLIAVFATEPLRRGDESGWVGAILDKFPLAYLPIIPMPAWALWLRIEQHGWTEFRYARALAVVGITLCFGYAAWKTLRQKNYSATTMPAVFSLLFFFASFGPWGALQISERSQQNRLADALAAPSDDQPSQDPWGDNRKYYKPQWSTPAHDRADYLVEHFGGRSLRPFLSDDQTTPTTTYDAYEALELDAPSNGSPSALLNRFRYEGEKTVPGAGQIYRVNAYRHGTTHIAADIDVEIEGLVARFTVDGEETHTFTFEKRLEKMRAYAKEKEENNLPASLMTLRSNESTDGRKAILFLRDLSASNHKDDRIDSMHGMLFLSDPVGE